MLYTEEVLNEYLEHVTVSKTTAAKGIKRSLRQRQNSKGGTNITTKKFQNSTFQTYTFLKLRSCLIQVSPWKLDPNDYYYVERQGESLCSPLLNLAPFQGFVWIWIKQGSLRDTLIRWWVLIRSQSIRQIDTWHWIPQRHGRFGLWWRLRLLQEASQGLLKFTTKF